jgi:hypothetical protein
MSRPFDNAEIIGIQHEEFYSHKRADCGITPQSRGDGSGVAQSSDRNGCKNRAVLQATR